MDFISAAIQWVVDNLLLVVGIAVGVLVLFWLLGVLVGLLPDKPLPTVSDEPVDGPDAAAIAVGLIQIDNSNGSWNDITARQLGASEKRQLQNMWGIADRQSWLAQLESLAANDRFDGPYETLLGLRGEAMAAAGAKPTDKQWRAAIERAGLPVTGEVKSFIANVSRWEKMLHKTERVVVIPKDYAVTSLAGYSYGQGVAMATWGVGFGFAEAAEAREIIAKFSAAARADFSGWEHLGRSYLLGRCLQMHRMTNGDNDKVENQMIGSLTAYRRALNPKIDGPWARLPWAL